MDIRDLTLYSSDTKRFICRDARHMVPLHILAAGILCIIIGRFSSMAWAGVTEGDHTLVLAFGSSCLIPLLFWVLSLKLWMQYADLLISPFGVCQQIYFVSGKCLAWTDIQSIAVTRVVLLENDLKPFCYFDFCRYNLGIKGDHQLLSYRHRIRFRDNSGESDSLISMINEYARKHDIKLYHVTGGELKLLERFQLSEDEA